MKREPISRNDFPGTATIVCCDGGFKNGKAAAGTIRIDNQFKISRGQRVNNYAPYPEEERHGSIAAEFLAAAIAIEDAPHQSVIDFYSDNRGVIEFINDSHTIPLNKQTEQLHSIYWRLKQALKLHQRVHAIHITETPPSIVAQLEECHDLSAELIGSRKTADKIDTSKSRNKKMKNRPPQFGGRRIRPKHLRTRGKNHEKREPPNLE